MLYIIKIILKRIYRFHLALVINLFTPSSANLNSRLDFNILKQIFSKKIKCSLGSAYISGKVEVSNNVTLFNDIEIFGNIKLSENVSISGPGTRICSAINRISIGSFTSIASNVIVQEYNHNIKSITTYDICDNIFEFKDANSITSKGEIIIEEDVWIGSNCVLLSGVKIGRGSIIGAGSIVTKDIPRYSVAAGNPCKVIKSRFTDKKIENLEKLQWWLWKKEKLFENKELFYAKE